jgi:hypothetical protein
MTEFDEVADFVLKATPPPLLGLYAALTELEYPINDKAAFEEAIEGRVGSETLHPEMGRLFYLVFLPGDFPLASAQNALEKFNLRLPEGLRIVAVQGQFAAPPRLEAFDETAPEQPGIEAPGSRALRPPFDYGWAPPSWISEAERRFTCLRQCSASYTRCGALARGDQVAWLRCAIGYVVCSKSCYGDSPGT